MSAPRIYDPFRKPDPCPHCGHRAHKPYQLCGIPTHVTRKPCLCRGLANDPDNERRTPFAHPRDYSMDPRD